MSGRDMNIRKFAVSRIHLLNRMTLELSEIQTLCRWVLEVVAVAGVAVV